MKAGEIVAGRYRLESRLGIGGMGEVWRAGHQGTGRDFAIKFMHAQAATSENARQRFSREARASAKINHPNIIDVFDVGELDDGVLYLVMELLDGIALGDAYHATPPLSVQDLLAVLLDTSHALSAAHAVGIIHRDIKPANVFLHRDRSTGLAFAKILDFGISKFTGDDVGTKTGSILGSPRYMSPEQTRSAAAADARADIWALGVMMYEGLTGTWPHDGDSFSALVVNICTVPPNSIDDVAPHLPAALRAIVSDCLKPINERIQSTAELANRIEQVLSDPTLASIFLPRPLHLPGEGIKSTTGLRVRPPSLSSSRNQGRTAPESVPKLMPPSPVPKLASTQSRTTNVHVLAQPPEPPTLVHRPPQAPPVAPPPPFNAGSGATQVMPGLSDLDGDTTTVGDAKGPDSGGATLLVESANISQGPWHPPRSAPTQPFPAQPTSTLRSMQDARTSNPGVQQPRPPDPLLQSVSAMNFETIALAPQSHSLQDSANIAPAASQAPAIDSMPQIRPRSSTNRKLGWAAAVLAAALLGIVVALVATIRSSPETASQASAPASGAPASVESPSTTAVATAAPVATAAKAEPAQPPAAAATAPVDTAAPKPSAKASAAPKVAPAKGPPPVAPPAQAATAAADAKKPPKHVQDLGSGL